MRFSVNLSKSAERAVEMGEALRLAAGANSRELDKLARFAACLRVAAANAKAQKRPSPPKNGAPPPAAKKKRRTRTIAELPRRGRVDPGGAR